VDEKEPKQSKSVFYKLTALALSLIFSVLFSVARFNWS